MATVQTIINRALAKLGVIGAGEDPEDNDNALCFQALKGVYRHLRTAGAFGTIYEVFPNTESYFANENEHIIRNADVTKVVILPESVANIEGQGDYGVPTFTVDENYVRAPRDMAYIAITDQATSTTLDYLYDGQNALWRCIETMTLNDVAPLSFRDENGLAACLAMHVADEFGQQVTQLISRSANRFEEGVTQNWSESGQLIQRNDYF